MGRIKTHIKKPDCKECGATCCKYGKGVTLKPSEFGRIFHLLPDKSFFGEEGTILFLEGRCPFLSEENECSCYDQRPGECRYFSCLHLEKNDDFFVQFPHVLALIRKYRMREKAKAP